MARYIVLRVEENEVADKLLAKLEPLESVRTVALYYAATKFCEGQCQSEHEARCPREPKYGMRYCPVCKRVKKTVMQQPRNLLEDPDLHPRFTDMHISVWEPFFNDPQEKYGADAIERKAQQVAQSAERLRRTKRRKARRGR